MSRISRKKNTESNLYSLTIRTGNGINLGSNPITELFTYIEKHCQYYCISLEKEENEAHFQGAIYYASPKRIDKVKEKLLPIVERMYLDQLGDTPYTEKGLGNVRKHAMKLEAHNDFDVLIRYTLKDGITPGRTPVINCLPKELIEYVPEQYCPHNEVSIYCSTCYKEESDEVTVLSERMVVKPFWTLEYYQKHALH